MKSFFKYHFFLFVLLAVSSTGCLMTGLLLLFLDLSFFLEWEVMSLTSSMSLNMTLILDWMACFFMFFVFLISANIMNYSKEYMAKSVFYDRFIILVSLFILSMAFLILSPNVLSLMLGWDGLGLTSYLLVIFYQNSVSAKAGMLTALSNRVGDAALLTGASILFYTGNLNFLSMKGPSNLAISLICLAAMTKSAQIPFSAWLPAAMAAPTPVSALVHSSTLVTAGVFLLIRFFNVLSENVKMIILVTGTTTTILASLAAILENDLKKVIALSTLSQLGLMMGAIGISLPAVSFFHLLSHAIFKALLFMTAGMLIHGAEGYQDIRKMSSCLHQMPRTASFMVIAILTLMGFPFLAGFYSKDPLLEAIFFKDPNSAMVIFTYSLATALTVLYSLRLLFKLCLQEPNHCPWVNKGESTSDMASSMVALFFMSVVMGSSLNWVLSPSLSLSSSLPTLAKSILLVSFFGICYSLSTVSAAWVKEKSGLLTIFNAGMWFIPPVSSKLTSNSTLATGVLLASNQEKGWLEYCSGGGAVRIVSGLSNLVEFFYSSVSSQLFLLGLLTSLCLFFM